MQLFAHEVKNVMEWLLGVSGFCVMLGVSMRGGIATDRRMEEKEIVGK